MFIVVVVVVYCKIKKKMPFFFFLKNRDFCNEIVKQKLFCSHFYHIYNCKNIAVFLSGHDSREKDKKKKFNQFACVEIQ